MNPCQSKYYGVVQMVKVEYSDEVQTFMIKGLESRTCAGENHIFDISKATFLHGYNNIVTYPTDQSFNDFFQPLFCSDIATTQWAKYNIYMNLDYLTALNSLIKIDDKFAHKKETTKRTKNPISILRRYKMYGLAPKPLPYKNFETLENSTNCLTSLLIEKYNTHPMKKSSSIAEKSILKFFENDNTTIDKLTQFIEKYSLKSRLFDALGNTIYINTTEKQERYGLYAIIYDNHIYPYKGTRMPNDYRIAFALSEGEYSDSFIYSQCPEYTEIEKIMINSIYKDRHKRGMNFLYESEAEIFIRSLTIYNTDVKPENTKAYDLKNAFWNSLLKYPKNQIGIFSSQNETAIYNLEPIIPTAYYFLSESRHTEITRSRERYYGALHSILLGYEIDHLIKRNVITRYDITHVKIPKETMEVQEIINLFDRIYAQNKDIITEHDKTQEKNFNILYNGILGKRYTTPQSISVLTDNNDDMDLLTEKDDVDFYENKYYSEMKRTIKSRRYIYINNRNIYDYIISITNLILMKFIDSCIDSLGCKVVKIKVDEVLFDMKGTISNCPDEFAMKDYTWQPMQVFNVWTDPYKIVRDTNIEIKASFDRCKVYIGAAGCGKTYTVKKEDDYDYACTMTNACARNMDTERIRADTLYNFLKLYDNTLFPEVLAGLNGKVLWIDEFSMINTNYWNFIFLLTKSAKSIYITGDKNQIRPVGDKLNYKCLFFMELFKDCEELTIDYRNSLELIELRHDILQGNFSKLPDLNELTNIIDVPFHLVYKNKTKNKINKYMMDALGHTLDIENKIITNELKLTPTISKKRLGIYKGMIYTVVASNETNIDLVSIKNTPLKIPYALLRIFIPAYSMTVHSVQGLTLTSNFGIHDIGYMKNDIELLYTAVTRARNTDQIYISNINLAEYPEWIRTHTETLEDVKESDD